MGKYHATIFFFLQIRDNFSGKNGGGAAGAERESLEFFALPPPVFQRASIIRTDKPVFLFFFSHTTLGPTCFARIQKPPFYIRCLCWNSVAGFRSAHACPQTPLTLQEPVRFLCLAQAPSSLETRLLLGLYFCTGCALEVVFPPPLIATIHCMFSLSRCSPFAYILFAT